MTKHQLKQLSGLTKEIELLSRRLDRLEMDLQRYKVADTVLASSKKYPYTLHAQWVGGYPVNAKPDEILHAIDAVKLTLESAICRCMEERAKIEQFIETIPDSEMRMIIALRYINGLSWEQVAAHISPYATEESVRKSHERCMQEKNK